MTEQISLMEVDLSREH